MSADEVILSVKLKSGDFDSSLHFPVDVPLNVKEAMVASWLELIRTALHTGVTEMTAQLGKEPRS